MQTYMHQRQCLQIATRLAKPIKRTWRHQIDTGLCSLYEGDVCFYRMIRGEVRRHGALRPAVGALVLGVVRSRLVVVLRVAS